MIDRSRSIKMVMFTVRQSGRRIVIMRCRFENFFPQACPKEALVQGPSMLNAVTNQSEEKVKAPTIRIIGALEKVIS